MLKRSAAGGRRPPEELIAAGPRGIVLPRVYGWVHDRALPDGKWQLASAALLERLPDLLRPADESGALRLISGRELHNHNRLAYGRFGYKRFDREDGATIGIHPARRRPPSAGRRRSGHGQGSGRKRHGDFAHRRYAVARHPASDPRLDRREERLPARQPADRLADRSARNDVGHPRRDRCRVLTGRIGGIAAIHPRSPSSR